MKFNNVNILMQEIPEEVSLGFEITGCPNFCEGCHSPELRNSDLGENLTLQILEDYIKKYENLITCVLFLGGDWHEEELLSFLKVVKKYNLKTSLYSGNRDISEVLKNLLDYYKIGRYDFKKGGLQSRTTNQKMFKKEENGFKEITYKFWLKGVINK